MNNVETMAAMLTYRRPHRSKTERKFIQRFLTSLGGLNHDKFGNRYKRIGKAPIMYSCHTDSVHRESGIQDIAVCDSKFKLHSKSKSNCLGADNGAGVWLMREMMLAEKPGLYIFHRGEECGTLGSNFIVSHTPELVKDIKAAIAFDRRGTKSIITHQWRGRCCSDAFAESMAKELKLNHVKDDGGTITDTGNYTDLIPECTNISVGFQNEHCSIETLDMNYLIELRQAMLEYNWENLVIKRKPGDNEPKVYHYTEYESSYTGGRSRWSRTLKGWEKYNPHTTSWELEPKQLPNYGKRRFYDLTKPKNRVGFIDRAKPAQGDFLADGHELDEAEKPRNFARGYQKSIYGGQDDGMLSMVKCNALLICKLLEDHGITPEDVAEFIHSNEGYVPSEYYGA